MKQWGRCNNTGCLPICLHPLWSETAKSEERSPIYWELGPLCLPCLPQAVFKLLREYMHSCLSHGWGWWMSSCYCDKSPNFSKFTAIYYPSYPLETASLQKTPKLPNSYIWQIWPKQWFSRWEHRFLVLPTLPSSQNPLCWFHLFLIKSLLFFFLLLTVG